MAVKCALLLATVLIITITKINARPQETYEEEGNISAEFFKEVKELLAAKSALEKVRFVRVNMFTTRAAVGESF